MTCQDQDFHQKQFGTYLYDDVFEDEQLIQSSFHQCKKISLHSWLQIFADVEMSFWKQGFFANYFTYFECLTYFIKMKKKVVVMDMNSLNCNANISQGWYVLFIGGQYPKNMGISYPSPGNVKCEIFTNFLKIALGIATSLPYHSLSQQRLGSHPMLPTYLDYNTGSRCKSVSFIFRNGF